MSEVLGVDFGGVITDRAKNDGTDTSFFTDNYLATTAVEGVFEALHCLVQKRFGSRAYIVSKCGPKNQQKTLHWLRHHNFYEITGIQPGHVHFCLERYEKAAICEQLGVTHFIDDKLEVLSCLVGVVPNRYLFQSYPEEVAEQDLSGVHLAQGWHEILTALQMS